MLSYIFEVIPVALAVWMIILVGTTPRVGRPVLDCIWFRFAVMFSGLCLIIAQTSWHATLLAGGLEDTVWSNHIWTVFNSLTMGCFIALFVKPKK